MTGRGFGYCAGYPHPGYVVPGGGGRWLGFGGWGRGWRHRYWYYATGLPGWIRWRYFAPYPAPFQPPVSPEQEKEALKQAAEDLRAELEEIERRIKELEEKK